MDIRDIRGMKARAKDAVQSAEFDPKLLILLYVGVTLAISVATSLLDWVLSEGINASGGLAGMGNRAILETVQTMVSLVVSILQPAWALGWIFVTLQLLRNRHPRPRDLLHGFGYFGKALRLMILQGLILAGLSVVGVYLAFAVFLLTPWGAGMMDVMSRLMESGTEILDMTELAQEAMPLMLLVLVTVCLLLIPVAYRMRFSQHFLLDYPLYGARGALSMSRRVTKGKCWRLFRLDLSFWWFYLLLALSSGLMSLGSYLLEFFLVDIGLVGNILCFLLSAVAQLLLYMKWGPYVEVTYAVCYEALIPPPPEAVAREERIQEPESEQEISDEPDTDTEL